jgi:hypothetical protein
VTGGDEGSGRLLIRLPWVKPEFGSEYGGPIVSPEGWPRLPPPELGETVAAFWERAIVGDAFLQLITPHTSDRRPVRSLDGRRPADLTLAWWERKWPYKVFDRRWDDSPPRGYHRDRVYWRLVVELIARWEAGDLVVKGRRLDVSTSEAEPVKLSLLRNPFMVLRPHHPHGGRFGPEEWLGHQLPTTLESYCELTVWPAEVAAADQGPDAANADKPPLPPFDPRKAKALLVARKDGGDWPKAPTEVETRNFLLLHFRGVSNDVHGEIRREVWPNIRRGRPPKSPR